MPFCKNVVLILKGGIDRVDLYLGIRASQISNAATAGDVFHDSFLGNFPGSSVKNVRSNEISSIFWEEDTDTLITSSLPNVAYINILPSERTNKHGEYVQGLEKFVDTMRGSEYICEILASPIGDREIETRMNGFEELYSALFPFSKKTSSHGHNEGNTLTEGITESISNSISKGLSKATGRSDGHTHGKTRVLIWECICFLILESWGELRKVGQLVLMKLVQTLIQKPAQMFLDDKNLHLRQPVRRII